MSTAAHAPSDSGASHADGRDRDAIDATGKGRDAAGKGREEPRTPDRIEPREGEATGGGSRWSKLDARQLGLVFALVLGSVYAFYLIVANALLSTGELRHLVNGRPEVFLLDYTYARSWFPGRVYVRGLTIRGKDSVIEWRLTVDRADTDIVLGELLRKHFHATRVHGDEISFRLRQRLPASAFTAKSARALPPVEGFATPPIAPAEPVPPLSDEDYNLFTATLENVQADHVREVWVDAYRYVGDSAIRGSFHLKPLREVEVGATRIDVHEGEMRVDDHAIIAGLAGTIDAAIRRFDPRNVPGATMVDSLSAGVHLDGTIGDASFADFYTDGAPALSGGKGPAHLHVLVRDGALEPGTTVDVASTALTVHDGEYTGTGDPKVRVETKQADGHVVTTARIDVPGTLHRKGYPDGPIHVRSAVATARTSDPQISHGFADVQLGIECDEADISDMRVVGSYLASDDLRLARGTGRASLKAAFTPRDGAISGEAVATTRSLFDHKKDHVEATFRADVKIEHGSLRTGVLDMSGSSLAITEADAIGGEHSGTKHWNGRIDLANATFNATKATFDSDVRVVGRDARPLLANVPLDLPEWIAGGMDTDGLVGSTHVRIGPSSMDAEPIALRAGTYHLDGRYRTHGDHSQGVFLVRKDFLTLGVGLNDGSPSLVLLGASAWYRDHVR